MDGIKINVTNNIAKVTEKPKHITTGTVGLPVQFTFGSQWDGLLKTAVFQAGLTTRIMGLLDDATVVPWEVLEQPGVWLSIGVYGVNEEGSIALPTVWANVRIIQPGANPCGRLGYDSTEAKKNYEAAQNAAGRANVDAEKACFAAERAVNAAEEISLDQEYIESQIVAVEAAAESAENSKQNAEADADRAEDAAVRAEKAAEDTLNAAESVADKKPQDLKVTATFDTVVNDTISTGAADVSAYEVATAISKGATVTLIDDDNRVYKYCGYRLEPNYSNAFFEAQEIDANGITTYTATINNEGQASRTKYTHEYAAANTDPDRHAEYFNVDYHGTISLKPIYGQDGSAAAALPEDIILPEIVNKTVVSALAANMFKDDWRIKSIVFPSTVDTIPGEFCNGAGALRNISNTEHITAVRDKAFRNTGIGKAIFPNLKELGGGAFSQCVLMSVVDIGNTITEIPSACFANCKNLSAVKGGASVKTVNANAFMFTYNLTSAPFIAGVTTMRNSAFQNSRIQYDWDSLDCTFGTCSTPIQDNTTDYWSGYTPEQCENPIVTLFNQRDPRWSNEQWGTTTGNESTYLNGCSPMSILHIHSAITGKKYANPKEFEAEISQLSNGAALLSAMPKSTATRVELLEALGYKVTTSTGTITAAIYQNMCEKLKAGAYVSLTVGVSASDPNGGHAVALYGINEYGEVLVLDSDNGNHYVGIYDDLFTYAIPFQNFTGPESDIIIIEKG